MLALGDRDSDQALKYFNLAKDLDPQQADIWALHGLTLIQMGRFDEAEISLTRCLQVDPRHHDGLINRGLLEMRRQQFGKAIHHLSETLRVNPISFAALRNMGLCYAHLGRFNEALHFMYEALRVYPGYVGADKDVGSILAMAGRLQEAKDHLARVNRENPADEDVVDLMQEVDRVLNESQTNLKPSASSRNQNGPPTSSQPPSGDRS